MVRQRAVDRLDAWFADAMASEVISLRTFAKHLRNDEAAVRAALQLQCSNGQTEGFVNKLKMLKRQMYGRADLDLLRIRMLADWREPQ